MNALSRDERQQELALEVAERISRFDSIGGLRSVATGLRDSVRLDSGMSLTRAVALAWAYRSTDTDEVERVSLPVSDYTTSDGAQVVRAEVSLRELLAAALDKDKSDLARDRCVRRRVAEVSAVRRLGNVVERMHEPRSRVARTCPGDSATSSAPGSRSARGPLNPTASPGAPPSGPERQVRSSPVFPLGPVMPQRSDVERGELGSS